MTGVVTDHVLTVDLGTSGPKVALFTLDGSFVDGDFTPVALNILPDGGVEQSPAAWWDGITAASRRLMARGSVTADTVVAVAVTSQWSGTVAVDRDGTPLHDAIIWMDSRGAEETSRGSSAAPCDCRDTTRASCGSGSAAPAARPRFRARTRSRTSSGCSANAPDDRTRDVEVPRAQGLAELPR